jgi:hypothetical protein
MIMTKLNSRAAWEMNYAKLNKMAKSNKDVATIARNPKLMTKPSKDAFLEKWTKLNN